MSQESGRGPICATCGAPDGGELVTCKYCRQPVNAEAARTAIPCPNPSCRMLCRWGKQKCGACQAWLVVQCIFCGSLSPHNTSNCMQCNEAFAGAPQRKAQMDQQRAHAENLNAVGTYGHVAAAFLGAAAGAAASNAWHDHGSSSDWDAPSSVDTYDASDVTEEAAGGIFDAISDSFDD